MDYKIISDYLKTKYYNNHDKYNERILFLIIPFWA